MHSSPSAFDDKIYQFARDSSTDEERRRLETRVHRCPYHIMAGDAWEIGTFHYHFGKPSEARKWLRQSLKDYTEYFLGDWRLTRPVDPLRDTDGYRPLPNEHAARVYTWSPGDYKRPLAAALALGDRRTAKRLAEYLLAERIETQYAADMIEDVPDAIDTYEAYAEMVLDRPVRLTAKTPFQKKVPHKRLVLMRECALAAADGRDADRCLAAIKALVKYVRTREIEKGEAYPSWLSTDATIAYHLMVARLGRSLELTRDDLYHVMVLRED